MGGEVSMVGCHDDEDYRMYIMNIIYVYITVCVINLIIIITIRV